MYWVELDMTSSLAALVRRFTRDASAAVSLLFACIAVAFFAFIGAAVDYGRWSDAHSRTVAALDTSLLAAGRSLQVSQNSEEALSVAEKMFDETAKTRLHLVSPELQISLVNNGAALEGVAKGKIKTPFLGLLNFGTLDVSATSKVEFSTGGVSSGGSDLEISIMLDVTGSMCDDRNGPCTSGTKLDALKSAASDLVNIILKSNNSGQGARIALVPFSTRVRIGPTQDSATEALMKKLTNLNPTWSGYFKNCLSSTGEGGSESEGEWTCTRYQNPPPYVTQTLMPCVSDRSGTPSDDFTDAPPGPGKWLLGHDGTRFPLSWDALDVALTTKTGKSASDPSDYWTYNVDGVCYDIEDPVLPLTSDKQLLLDRISALSAFGSTSGALGTAWSWYTLSPKWSSIWTGASAPGPYSDLAPIGSKPPKLRKIAVLMTDGAYNTLRAWKDYDPAVVSGNAKQICSNMKSAGIEVFTVGFDLDSLPADQKSRAIDTLQNCGTDLSHFYEALSAEQLKQSFRDIAMQLAQIFVAR